MKMTVKKNISAISGSTRTISIKLNLIRAVNELSKDIFIIKIFEGFSSIPYYNVDLDNEESPERVVNFHRQLKEADGILIYTPEYAMGVPGTLKKAIDGTVSSCEFTHIPTALIIASSLGQHAHTSLLETLKNH
jgi:chromate reductase